MADQQIRIITGLLKKATEKVVTALSVNVTAELIETTPIDLGWARANWVPAIGSPLLEPVADNVDASMVPNQKATQEAAVANIVTSYKLNRGPVFISNNVPYITRLNDGSSAQAPAGFVQSAIATAISSLGNRIPT